MAAAGTVRIKSLNSRLEEVEVPTEQVPAHLIQAMQPHAAAAAAGSRTPLAPGRSGLGPEENEGGEGGDDGSGHAGTHYRRRRDRR